MTTVLEQPPLFEMFEDHWLPRRPLAAAAKHGPYYRTSRARAMGMPYIEANPLALRSLVITDHDGGRADEITGLLGLPEPSYIALNPITRSGHIVYVLAAPVCLTDAGRRAPVNLLARIESGLCTVLGGDVAYAGRITKNPRHSDHLPIWGAAEAVYGLRDLADPLVGLKALPRYTDQRTLTNSGVGRNVALFEDVRRWAYRHRRKYLDAAEWEQVVHGHTQDRNLSGIADVFARGPLGAAEVVHLARSISRWTWRNVTAEAFAEIQARRGRIGGRATGPTKARNVRKVDRRAALLAAVGEGQIDGC